MEGCLIPTCTLYMKQEDKYYPVRGFPVAEMLGRTEVELADEWIEITNGVEWREQGRRPVREFDVMQLGDVQWMYIKTSDVIKHFNYTGAVVQQLQAMPYYSIGRLVSAGGYSR